MKITVSSADQKPVVFPCLRSGKSSGDVYLVLSEIEAVQFRRTGDNRLIHHKSFAYGYDTLPFHGSVTIEVD